MAWRIEFGRAAPRELDKLGAQEAQHILRFLRERIGTSDDPRSLSPALKGERLGEFWRYRVGDYRVIARIEDAEGLILVLRMGIGAKSTVVSNLLL